VTKGKDMGKTFACASPKIYGVEWERVGSGVGGAPAQSLFFSPSALLTWRLN